MALRLGAAADIKISKTQTAALIVRLRSGARVNMVLARRSNAARVRSISSGAAFSAIRICSSSKVLSALQAVNLPRLITSAVVGCFMGSFQSSPASQSSSDTDRQPLSAEGLR